MVCGRPADDGASYERDMIIPPFGPLGAWRRAVEVLRVTVTVPAPLTGLAPSPGGLTDWPDHH